MHGACKEIMVMKTGRGFMADHCSTEYCRPCAALAARRRPCNQPLCLPGSTPYRRHWVLCSSSACSSIPVFFFLLGRLSLPLHPMLLFVRPCDFLCFPVVSGAPPLSSRRRPGRTPSPRPPSPPPPWPRRMCPPTPPPRALAPPLRRQALPTRALGARTPPRVRRGQRRRPAAGERPTLRRSCWPRACGGYGISSSS